MTVFKPRPSDEDSERLLAVTQVRLDAVGRIADIWWTRVAPGGRRRLGVSSMAPVAEAVQALRAGMCVVSRAPRGEDDDAPSADRHYVVVDLAMGRSTIQLEAARAHSSSTLRPLRPALHQSGAGGSSRSYSLFTTE